MRHVDAFKNKPEKTLAVTDEGERDEGKERREGYKVSWRASDAPWCSLSAASWWMNQPVHL